MEETTRLFVALRPPAETRARLREMQAALSRELPAKLRWTPEDQLHLTLFFAPAFPAPRIEALADAFARPCADQAPFAIELGAPVTRTSRGAPRVIWLPLHGPSKALADLHRLLGEAAHALEPAECPLPNRPFRPHLTLGRFPRNGPRGISGAIHRAAAAPAIPPWLANDAELIASQIERDGARHTPVRHFPFAPSTGREAP